MQADKLSLNGSSYENQVSMQTDGASISGGNLVVPARKEIVVRYAWPALHPAHSLPQASQ